jgi:hypothetical protein
MDRRSLITLMIFAFIADTETAFAQEQIGRPGAPVPTQPFPLFHNPTDRFVPSAPGITRYYDFRAQQQRPSRPPNTRPPDQVAQRLSEIG